MRSASPCSVAVNSKPHSFERSREFPAELPRFMPAHANLATIWIDERVLPHDTDPQKSRRKRGQTPTPRAKLSALSANSWLAKSRYTVAPPWLGLRNSLSSSGGPWHSVAGKTGGGCI